MMYGRRGIKRATDEAELNPYRERFCAMFQRLQREHGITHYLAHNMTVTPRNLEQIAGVVRDCRKMGFRMFSFQPAAYVGNRNRWKDEYRSFSGDAVWHEIEHGAGARLPFRVFQMGDERCNRTTHGLLVGERFVPLVDDQVAADHAVRDAFFETFGGMDFEAAPPLLAARLTRALLRRPRTLATGAGWVGRFAARAGIAPLLLERRRPLTFVMHSFMDARDVRPAWDALQRGEESDDPRIRDTQERLQACSYAMAHPESGELVPACVQHSVLDPEQNLRLQQLLPLSERATVA